MQQLNPLSISSVRRMIAHDGMANRRSLASMRAAERIPPRVQLWMPHIVVSQQNWLARLHGVHDTVPAWPEWTISETETQLSALHEAWCRYLDVSPEPDLYRPIEYRNTVGESHSTTPEDVVRHVLFHARYYRRQIAAEIRAVNGIRSRSDFAFALRDPVFGQLSHRG